MKYRLCFLLLSGFVFNFALAQNCNFPLPPANTCQNAPLLCDLDGYCSNNANAVNSGTPNAFCGVVENNHWVAFIAGSPTFILEVRVDNCNQGSGLQAQVFATNNCQNFQAVSNCIDPVTTSATLTATELTIGEQYYLMIDGKGGDICDYSLRLLSGETQSPAEAIIQPAGALCTGGTLELSSISTTPNADLSYQWVTIDGNILGGSTSPTLSVDSPGNYQLSIVDAGGCTDSATIDLALESLPEFVIAEPDVLNCLTNLQVNLEAIPIDPTADYSYNWFTDNGSFIDGELTASPTVNQAGSYQLIVSDNTTGCSQPAAVEVTADINTPIAILNGAEEINCLITSIDLEGTGSSTGNNFTYRWLSSDGNFIDFPSELTATIDAPGTYTLEVNNQENGCTSSADVLITENTAVPTGLDLVVIPSCYQSASGSVRVREVIGGTPSYRFSFDGSSFQNQRNYYDLAAGTYLLTVQDQTGCSLDTLVTLTNTSPFILELGDDQEISLGCQFDINPLFNRTLSEIDTFIWTPAIDCEDCIYPVLSPLRTITYELEAIDVNGCRARDQLRIFVREDRKVFLPNAFSPNNDGTNDVFYIQTGKSVAEVLAFKIFNRWGALVFDQGPHLPNDPVNGWRGLLNNKLAPKGGYVYQAELRFVDDVIKQYTGDVLLMR